jgi:hypothetical protein
VRLRVLGCIFLVGMMACGDESAGQLDDAGGRTDASSRSDSGVSPDAGALPGDALFDRAHLIQVEVELSAGDWALIRGEGRGLTTALTGCAREFEYTYVSGRVTVDGQTYEDVAVRKKGFLGSLSAKRPSLKLNFGRLMEGRTHAGMKRMTLNNNKQDPSNTHQCMAYDLFAGADTMAPRCNFAHVVVNGEDLGIYTHVESVKKPMLARYFADNGGNLYEGQGTDFVSEHRAVIELKTNEMENDRADFDRLSDALQVTDDQLLDELGKIVDLDAFFTFWAMEVMTGHWDSYSGGRNNYLAYHDPTSDRFHFIPWGTDGAFSMQRPFTPGNTAATVLAQGLMTNRLYNHPQGRTMYFDRLRDLFDRVWDESALLAEVDHIQALTDAPQSAIDAQKAFIASHGAAIRRELGMAPVEWVGGGLSGPPMCRSDLVTEARGTFSTTWLSDNTPRPGQTLDITINGQPWMPAQLLGSAGLDQMSADTAQIRYLSPQSDGTFIFLGLSIPLTWFSVGEHPMHGLEINGVVVRFDPQNPSGFVLIGFIGDGHIKLDAASTEPGGAVSGSFEGKLFQMRPL